MYLPAMDARVMAMSAGVCLLVTLIVGSFPLSNTSPRSGRCFEGRLLRCGRGPGRAGCARPSSSSRLVSASFCWWEPPCCSRVWKRFEAQAPLHYDHAVATGSHWRQQDTMSASEDFSDKLIDRISALPGVSPQLCPRDAVGLHHVLFHAIVVTVTSLRWKNDLPWNTTRWVLDISRRWNPSFLRREFARTDDENAPMVAIVNRNMVMHYWPGRSGRRRLQVRAAGREYWL